MALAPSAGTTQQLDPDQLDALRRLYENRDKLDGEDRAIVDVLGPQYGFKNTPTKGETIEKALHQTLRQGALPVMGQIVGGAIEGALTRGADTVAGQSIGAMLGVKGNEMLGISKPTEMDYYLAGMAPPVAATAMRAGRALIPGHEAALQQMAVPSMKAVPQKVVAEATKPLYDKLAQYATVPLPAKNFEGTLARLGQTEAVAKQYGLGNASINRLVTKGEQAMGGTGQMDFGNAVVVLKRLREKVAGLEEKGGEVWGAYKAARGALFEDLNNAAKAGGTAGQAAADLRIASQAAKQSIAKEELTEVISKYGTRTVNIGGNTLEVIEPTKVLGKLRQMDFSKSVGLKEWQDIEQTLTKLGKIPQPGGAERVALGTTGRIFATTGGQAATALAAGAGAGAFLAGPAGATAGAAAAVGAHEAVARLAMSPWGRKALVTIFTANKGAMGAKTAAALELLAAQGQQPVEP